MKIGIAGHIWTESLVPFLGDVSDSLPKGYWGAPFMATLIGELLKRGHEVVAFTTSTDISLPVTALSNSKAFTIHYAPARAHGYLYRNGAWGKAIDSFKQERNGLKKAMLEAKTDIIHAHWSYEFALAALDSGIPCLITCHDAPQVVLRYMPNLYRLVRYFMARNVLKNASSITAVSSYLKDKIKGYTTAEISIIPNPLDDKIFGYNFKPHMLNPNSPRIAMVLNGWSTLKNAPPAIMAFSLIRKKLRGATLSIFGADYEASGKAAQWAQNNNLTDGVSFVGQIAHRELLLQLSEFDLLVHPSLEETFGMSVAEAMALGIPVVGGKYSGAVPWVIGDGGVLVDVREPKLIEKAVVGLCNDLVRYNATCIKAKDQTLRRFSLKSIVDRYEKEYELILTKVFV